MAAKLDFAAYNLEKVRSSLWSLPGLLKFVPDS